MDGGTSFIPVPNGSALAESSVSAGMHPAASGGSGTAGYGTVPATVQATPQEVSRPELLPGGAIPVPAQGDGWSVAIYLPDTVLPNGEQYAICRRLKDDNPFRIQYATSDAPDTWHDYVEGASGSAERYQSDGSANVLVYYFVPQTSSC